MIERRHRLNGIATAGLFVLLWATPAAGQTAREVEDVFWRDVVCERELEVRAYLETYPDGAYVSEARACLEQGLGLTRTERVAVQRGLAEVGQEPGPADGLFGGPETKTRQAIRAWQAAKGMDVTGYLSREQADILIVTGQAVEERQRAAAERAAQEEAARQAAAADDAAYAAAEGADSAAAYGDYLEAYPAGRHAAAARERQAERQAAAEQAAREEAARRVRDAALRVGQTFRDDLRSGGEGPEMVVVPAGSFRMGSPSYEAEREDTEGPVHRVTISEAFAVGVHEVTLAEWDACVAAGGCGGHRPNDGGGGWEGRPVIGVSWKDAQSYVGWLTRESGARYRLLSEAEWEYVARAGSETLYNWGNEIGRNRAKCNGCGSRRDGKQTAPVGSFGANGFGLHDVHGNVWEWVEDCWNGTYAGAPADGSALEQGDCNRRVVRGGSWGSFPRDLRSASRYGSPAGSRRVDIGCRVARSLTP